MKPTTMMTILCGLFLLVLSMFIVANWVILSVAHILMRLIRRPATPTTEMERAAYMRLMERVAFEGERGTTWCFITDDHEGQYIKVRSAESVLYAAQLEGGTVHVVRWDDDEKQFIRETVTADMPLDELAIR